MQKLRGIALLKSADMINKEIQVLERQIRDQSAAMLGYASMKITDMPKGKQMPAGMDKVLANKDELEITQRETIACLYEQLREAEILLQSEKNAEMRIVMRIIYVEKRPANYAQKLMKMSRSGIDRIIKRVKEKYGENKEAV